MDVVQVVVKLPNAVTTAPGGTRVYWEIVSESICAVVGSRVRAVCAQVVACCPKAAIRAGIRPRRV